MYGPYQNVLRDTRPFRDAPSQIRDLTQDFAISFNTGNYDQAAAMFATDGVLMVPEHETVSGPKSVERLLRQLGEAEYSGMRMVSVRVEHSGDLAMETGQFSAVTRKADGTTVTARGKYVRVWRRLGVWLMLADCWSRTQEAQNQQAA